MHTFITNGYSHWYHKLQRNLVYHISPDEALTAQMLHFLYTLRKKGSK